VITLVTDSASQLPAALRERFGVRVVPLTVTIDGTAYLEGVDLDLAGITAALERGATVGSSTPSPGQFLQTYEQAAADGATHVLSIHSGGSASGTANTARLAAGMAPIPVQVVDTGSVSFPVAMAVWAAAEALAEGLAAAVAATELAIGNVFVVSTLALARRGGRLADGVDGSPVLALESGQMRPVRRVVDGDAAVDTLVGYVLERAQGQRLRVGVGHIGAPGLAEALEAALRAQCDLEQLVRYDMGPSVAVHTGLGTAGCCFHPI
jgi:DegV family protein with EDD domain